MKTSLKMKGLCGLFVLATAFGCNETREDVNPAVNTQNQSAVKRAEASSSIKFMKDSYIIISETNGLPEGLGSKVSALQGRITRTMPQVGIATATSKDPDFIAKASKIAGVKSVIRDAKVQWFDPKKAQVFKHEDSFGNPPNSGDDDELFDLQWGHDAIDAPEAWERGYRGRGTKVAILDTGFDLDHPDLAANIDMATSRNFVPGEDLQYGYPDAFSHGTHVAGTVAAADNGIGVIGVAPEAELMLVKVLGDDGYGLFSWIFAGIIHAANEDADVINMSLTAVFPRDGKIIDEDGNEIDASREIQEIVAAMNRVTHYANRQGTTIIAAAGNDFIKFHEHPSYITLPAEAMHVISISSTAPIGWALAPTTTSLDNPATYANYGDFAAPGGDVQYEGDELATIASILAPVYVFDMVFSTGNDSWYWSIGTSMAAPHAAGVAALIIGKNGGSMSPLQVRSALRLSTDDLGRRGTDPVYGLGRINAFKAVTGGSSTRTRTPLM